MEPNTEEVSQGGYYNPRLARERLLMGHMVPWHVALALARSNCSCCCCFAAQAKTRRPKPKNPRGGVPQLIRIDHVRQGCERADLTVRAAATGGT
jgi:hypothetical protein